MIKGEYTVIKLDTYDKFKTQERLFDESQEGYKIVIKDLQKRKFLIDIGRISYDFYCKATIMTDEEFMNATFDEFKDQHKKEIDKLINRTLWQRIINKKP